jgi:hypothetical protein
MTAADQIVRSAKKMLAMEGRPHMTTQSAANRSPGQIPCYQGKEQGIFGNCPDLAACSGSKRLHHQILANRFPYAIEQGINSAQQGICFLEEPRSGKAWSR